MEINKTLTKVETGFNLAGSIPIVAIFSGAFRMTLAKIQFIFGAIIGFIGLIGQMIHNGSKKMEELMKTGERHLVHGALNWGRGLGESLIGLTLIGSAVLGAIQMGSKNKFAPIVKYDKPPVDQFSLLIP